MPNALRITLDSSELQGLVSQLSLLEREVGRPLLVKALRLGAEPILAAARDYAPKDTLLLMNSLRIKSAKAQNGGVAVRVTTEEGDYRGQTFYGAFLEYGHRRGPRSRRKGGPGTGKSKGTDNRPLVPAQPYMRPAADEQKDNALRIATDFLKTEIEKLSPK